MIGAFPPPVHGMSAVNSEVRHQLQQLGLSPLVIDIGPRSLSRSPLTRVKRFSRILHSLFRFLRTSGLDGTSLYLGVSGGGGQIYEILFLLVARYRQMRIFLHHHSFAYLDNPSWITGLLIRVAGSASTHIALSEGMMSALSRHYPKIVRAVPISNAVFFVPINRSSRMALRRQLSVVGFLSNISQEKGIFEFLSLLETARNTGLELAGKIAGPFLDKQTERRVIARLKSLPNVEYLGPKYGCEKQDFLRTTDALIFPTRYVNEAEPMTLYEAMVRGIPVIAYGRGCIPEIVDTTCGKTIVPGEPFVPEALAQIRLWLENPSVFEAASRGAATQFFEIYSRNLQRWSPLLEEIAGVRA